MLREHTQGQPPGVDFGPLACEGGPCPRFLRRVLKNKQTNTPPTQEESPIVRRSTLFTRQDESMVLFFSKPFLRGSQPRPTFLPQQNPMFLWWNNKILHPPPPPRRQSRQPVGRDGSKRRTSYSLEAGSGQSACITVPSLTSCSTSARLNPASRSTSLEC